MEQNRLIIGREKKILSDGLYYANGRGSIIDSISIVHEEDCTLVVVVVDVVAKNVNFLNDLLVSIAAAVLLSMVMSNLIVKSRKAVSV